jgi:hypothetical protein
MDDSVRYSWYRAKTPLKRQGFAVPVLFRVAMTSDAKDYLAKRKTRRLWTMPVHKALSVARGDDPKPHSERPNKEQHQQPRKYKQRHLEAQGHAAADNGARHSEASGGKRERVDRDGDVIMVRQPL